MRFETGIYKVLNTEGFANLQIAGKNLRFQGSWITGAPWERFGKYNSYVIVRDDLKVLKIQAHAGELAPGSTEDLVVVLNSYDVETKRPSAPLTLELDATNRCYSVDCGGHCFSAKYRMLNPDGQISTDDMSAIIKNFAEYGGRIVRFDGGGDPLAHQAVRSGELPALAHQLNLKTTILTSGDAFKRTNLERIGKSNCYLRVSLNAAANKTRQVFHGNKSKLTTILKYIETFSYWLSSNNPGLPIGATYLLGKQNYAEVYDCALIAKDSGINHFSVRRVLGPTWLRPVFTEAEKSELNIMLQKIQELSTEDFRVFLPWRPVDEPDLNPSNNDFTVSQCWQSTFKTIIEPSLYGDSFSVQLCGRYRGKGSGQSMQLPQLFASSNGTDWVNSWRNSFTNYKISRQDLPNICTSCIDRGFIKMMDNLIAFLDLPHHKFEILHLYSNDPSDTQETVIAQN